MKILTDLDQLQLDRIEAKLDQLLAKKKRKPQQSRVEYPEWFERLWDVYPKRSGSNPKRKAYNVIGVRLTEKSNQNAELPLTQRTIFADKFRHQLIHRAYTYKEFCDATGKTGTEFVMQAATFFGPDRHYENDWSIPKQKKDPAVIESATHDAADFSRDLERSLDPVDPYADLK